MIAEITSASTELVGLAAVGVVVGLGLVVRGFAGYRSAGRISGTSTSRIASIALGEVLVTGAAEPVEVVLVSPLQSVECLYYHARISASGDGENDDLLDDDRAVGFRVRDASGTIRVFPRGARFDVPDRYDETSDGFGDPIGLRPRTGPIYAPGPDDRDAQIADLLTVHRPSRASILDGGGLTLGLSRSRRLYREARIEPGDIVTVMGRVLPFADLTDPTDANVADGTGVATDDPEIAAGL